ncbi:MAG: hypothetical protein ACLP22_16565, partial [Solirubrobacteraceae bacterium]
MIPAVANTEAREAWQRRQLQLLLLAGPLACLPQPDTGSHAGAVSAHTRASTKTGVGPLFMSDLLVARSESQKLLQR